MPIITTNHEFIEITTLDSPTLNTLKGVKFKVKYGLY